MPLKRITPPEGEPVDLADAKAQARVSHDFENRVFERKLAAAREYAEDGWGVQLLPAAWRLTLPGFPGHCRDDYWDCRRDDVRPGRPTRRFEIRLPRPPLISVTSIQYVDPSGDLQTLDEDTYGVDTDGMPGRVWPLAGTCWPVARREPNAVRITYEAGYPDAASVPEKAKQAILLVCQTLYEQRSDLVTGAIVTQLPFGVQDLLDATFAGGYLDLPAVGLGLVCADD